MAEIIISCNVNTLACFIICLVVKKCVQVCQCVKCYATTRRTLAIGDRQMGQPLSVAATVSAHVMQKRECPQGPKATPSRGAMRQMSHVADTAYILPGIIVDN